MTYDDPRFFRVILGSGGDEYPYEITTFFGRDKAIFMAAVQHTTTHEMPPLTRSASMISGQFRRTPTAIRSSVDNG
jgi:hypothetical protein